jgi:hypothetical protein
VDSPVGATDTRSLYAGSGRQRPPFVVLIVHAFVGKERGSRHACSFHVVTLPFFSH